MTGFPPRLAPSLRPSLTCLAACCALALAACATPPMPPPTSDASLPTELRAGQHEVLQEVMTTHGDETYVCRRIKAATQPGMALPGVARDGTQLLWDPLGSEAILVDSNGQSAGTVAPGRYFLSYDGSYVIGKVAAESQVGANALTWVRYTARFVAAPRPGEGRFADISSIQRIDTSGGLPPQPDCEVEGAHLLVPYGATYMFYRAKGLAPVALSANQAAH
ncbi:DUF3455 domain-containing protein [Paraburkholderia phytofirmans]|jgi:hypothetical protein|uniref:DUF3455 domain-containing protein n=1 Tax=Paraburkholderia dipogonis TaxID=1211383 RepID=A0ABW9ASL7_9BURK|nr:DUF3455 domain-containing protein [Paraburkholderia sp. BL9I2N2]TCK87074.1 uncharacterized protein DUF3455 [Paraburkholderia sp. BL9I2N2]